MHYKGFSVMRSFSIDESALMICNIAYKLRKSADKEPYYKLEKKILPSTTETTEEEPVATTEENYCHVVKKVKKDNITPDNIGEIMLSQIPGISSVSAIAVMKEFKTVANLIAKVKEEGEKCLTQISYVNEKQQTRKINKTVIGNLVKFLCA
jgi:ERCC4-type nuclease